jgi:hypothetical protein
VMDGWMDAMEWIRRALLWASASWWMEHEEDEGKGKLDMGIYLIHTV